MMRSDRNTNRKHIRMSPEVKEALKQGKPVVALESTIIAHGMPYPRNVQVGLALQNIAREMGVVPATVAVLGGAIRVGLTGEEIECLGDGKKILKVSRRDLGWAVSRKLDGATTVSSTMIAAHSAGIRVFATGGIGGVHRGAAGSRDVSADLREFAHTPVIVVSAGAKAILDLGATLEYLETLGVPVIGYKTDEFPAFYSRSSGLPLQMRVERAGEIAEIFLAQQELCLCQGILVANPIPKEFELSADEIRKHIDAALVQLEKQGVSGKEVTPFLLGKIVELSGGAALEANIHLAENNVRLACEIAIECATVAAAGPP